MEILGRVAMGVQPTTQWAPVFANPHLMGLPGLRCKAFTVWFSTMLDFVGQAAPQLQQLVHEATTRDLDLHGLDELGRQLEESMVDVLRLFTREEQLFLVDRRHQNVHGLVSQFFRNSVGVKWFNGEAVMRARMTETEYHSAIGPLYDAMQLNELDLLERCITSEPWKQLGLLVQGPASMERLRDISKALPEEPA